MKRLTNLLLILALGLVSVLSWGQAALAQVGKEPASFRNVVVWVNPEYDDPRLLVMLEGRIVGADPPATVRFLVPAAAEMFSAGSKDASGKYSGGPPRRKPADVPGWDEISYEVKSETFRVEYYDPIILGQPDKKISYDFRWLYPISELRVMVQEPRTSSDYSISPKEDYKGSDEGMAFHGYDYRNLTPDPAKPLHFEIAYTKSDPNPSVSNPSLNGPAGVAGESSARPMVIVAILAAVAAVVVFGLAYISKSRNRPRTRQQLRYAERNTRPEKARPVSPDRAKTGGSNQGNRGPDQQGQRPQPGAQGRPARFCPQCGHPQEGGGSFCTECGAKLR